MASTGIEPPRVYDSAQARPPVLTEFRNLWTYRGLLRLLVVRDITVRYKRSLLGVWWTLLNPLLTAGVLWLVFSQLLRFELPGDEPYIVYVLSGLLVITFFQQGVVQVGNSIVGSASVLSKVYVPAEVFSLAAASAAAVNFLLSLVPLLVIQLVVGQGIPWTVLLVPIPALALLGLAAGVGLIVASAAVHFYDVIDLTGVVVQLIAYLTPGFYPIGIVPESYRPLLMLNPLYHYLLVFRGFVYGGEFAPLLSFAVMGVTSLAALALGVWVFSRSWRNAAALL